MLPASILLGLVLVRVFIIYHDFQHGTILKGSRVANVLLSGYGMLVLKGVAPVTAPALLRAARQSGLRIQRAHRPLEGHGPRVSSSGHRRGRRYRLTPAGIEHCEKLIPDLLARLGA